MTYGRSPVVVALAVSVVGLGLAGLVALRPAHAAETPADPATASVAASAPAPPAPNTPQYFDAHVAPLLARHCLECHDTATKKGKLDLSRKEAALAGGKNGRPIVPGKSAESLLWEAVDSGEMPEDRPPLSAEEKKVLREWIDAGAVWSGVEINASAAPRGGGGRAAQNWLRRLTMPEYVETVRA